MSTILASPLDSHVILRISFCHTVHLGGTPYDAIRLNSQGQTTRIGKEDVTARFSDDPRFIEIFVREGAGGEMHKHVVPLSNVRDIHTAPILK